MAKCKKRIEGVPGINSAMYMRVPADKERIKRKKKRERLEQMLKLKKDDLGWWKNENRLKQYQPCLQ